MCTYNITYFGNRDKIKIHSISTSVATPKTQNFFFLYIYIYNKKFNLNSHIRIFWESQGSNTRIHREVARFGEMNHH